MATPRASRRRFGTSLVAALLTLFLIPGLTLGHAELETATPADQAIVSEPVQEISATFSEALDPDLSSLEVEDENGAVVATGSVDPRDDRRMIAVPDTPLGDGTYRVRSTAGGADGHLERTRWTFSVDIASASPTPSPIATSSPATSAEPSAPATAPAQATPTPETPAAATTPPQTPAPSDAGGTAGSDSDVILPIVIGLLVLGAGAAYLLTRRGRQSDQA
jgi:methionine-rich copper-binding protein CopC